jgi:hypothetical protein
MYKKQRHYKVKLQNDEIVWVPEANMDKDFLGNYLKTHTKAGKRRKRKTLMFFHKKVQDQGKN